MDYESDFDDAGPGATYASGDDVDADYGDADGDGGGEDRLLGKLKLDPDTIIDQLVPASVDWRGTVRRHPVASVVSVSLVGYVIGRTKGAAILTGVTAALSSALMRQLSDVFEGDFFEF